MDSHTPRAAMTAHHGLGLLLAAVGVFLLSLVVSGGELAGATVAAGTAFVVGWLAVWATRERDLTP